MFNLIGMMPAPAIYGLISKLSGDDVDFLYVKDFEPDLQEPLSRIPMALLVYMAIPQASFLIYVIYPKLTEELDYGSDDPVDEEE
jgi:hypothetical protein